MTQATSTPIPTDHPRLGELISKLGCDGVPVAIGFSEHRMQHSQCYNNVDTLVKAQGGCMRVGWMLRMWPGVYMCAEHHAVWERQDGTLIDPTEPSGAIAGERYTQFLCDERIQFDPEVPPNVRTAYVALRESKDIVKFIASYNEFHAATQRFIDAVLSEKAVAVPVFQRKRHEAQQRMFKARDRLVR